MEIDKSKLVDGMGKPLTQGLFLEIGYNTDYAIYTLKENDYTYKGKLYPALKRLYLLEEDPTEYVFATKHLLNWKHWKRICENVMLRRHIDEWREELELKLRSQAIRDMQNLCSTENGNFSAAKFLADRGWDKRAAGRPSSAEKEKRLAMDERLNNEFNSDVARLADFRKG